MENNTNQSQLSQNNLVSWKELQVLMKSISGKAVTLGQPTGNTKEIIFLKNHKKEESNPPKEDK